MQDQAQKSQDASKRRRRYRVERDVQNAIARRLVYQWLVFLVVAAMVLPMFHVMMRGDFTRPLSQTLADTGSDFAILLVTFLCLLPYFLLDTYKLTNRFAGPIYRLRNTIRAIVRGENAKPLKFRKGDFWHELADEFNAMRDQNEGQTGGNLQRRNENTTDEAPSGTENASLHHVAGTSA